MLTWRFFTYYLLSKRAGAVIRRISWICILGVAIGVMSLILVTSVMNGFHKSIRDRMLRVEPHLVVHHEDGQPGLESFADLLQTELEGVSALKEPIEEVYFFDSQDVILRTLDGVFGGAVAKGLPAESLKQVMQRVEQARWSQWSRARLNVGQTSWHDPAKEGMDIEPFDLQSETYDLREGEIIMGIDLARSLGLFEGDQVTVIPPESLLLPAGEMPRTQRVTVRSLLSTEVVDIDSSMIFYVRGRSLQWLTQESLSLEQGVEFRLKNANEAIMLATELKKRGYRAASWADRNSALFFALRLEKIVMTTFLSLSALITSFSIMTVLILLLNQKKKDIGILMAMGLSQRQTQGLFVRVGLWLSGIGVGVGLFLGLLVAFLLDRYPIEVLPDIYYDATIPAEIDWLTILWITGVALTVATLSSWLPSRAQSKLTPTAALRS